MIEWGRTHEHTVWKHEFSEYKYETQLFFCKHHFFYLRRLIV